MGLLDGARGGSSCRKNGTLKQTSNGGRGVRGDLKQRESLGKKKMLEGELAVEPSTQGGNKERTSEHLKKEISRKARH